MSGIQRYGALSEYGGNRNGDARLFKKYSPNISWGNRVFYRRNETASLVYEVTNFPQELKQYAAANGVIDADKDPVQYINVDTGFLVFNGDIYRFGMYETHIIDGTVQDVFVPSDELNIDTITDINTLNMSGSNVFKAQKSDIWYWQGDKYVYTLEFDCINTTPITTSVDEPIGGALAKSQTVVLKTQFFNDVDDNHVPTRFDIIEWGGDLYIVDEQDTVPQYRPALVNYYLISMTKLL